LVLSPLVELTPAILVRATGKGSETVRARGLVVTGVKVWMINTGWSGGPYLKGSRIRLAYTRAIIRAALEGKLDNVEYGRHPIFGMAMPLTCPDVPAGILNPRSTWPDPAAYDEMAASLAGWFINNFKKYEEGVTSEVRAAGPSL